MDAVILAGGRGQRLNGHVLPFTKPLIEVDGKPLLLHALEYAMLAGVDAITIVASPNNLKSITALVYRTPWVHVITQDEPAGPGHALLLALEYVQQKRFMLLMSDNIMDVDKVVAMVRTATQTDCDAVGSREIALNQADRFTRIRRGRTVDGERRPLTFVESEPVTEDDEWYPGSGTAMTWCGPIVTGTDRATRVLAAQWQARQSAGSSAELKIGPYLNDILRHPVVLTPVSAIDIGVPDVLKEFRT